MKVEFKSELKCRSIGQLEVFQIWLQRQARVTRIPLIRLRDRDNPLERYNAVQFKLRYHLYKDTAVYMAELTGTKLSTPLRRGVHIPPLLQFLTGLSFMQIEDFSFQMQI